MTSFIYLFLLSLILSGYSYAQTSVTILDEDEMKEVFPPHVCEEYGITYDIYRIYRIKDDEGMRYLLLTEHMMDVDGDSPKNDSIKAFCYKADDGLVKDWSFRDFIDRGEAEENSMWFWTKFAVVEDVDGDGFVDPIIVYGTSGPNGTDDGRIKILIYYKGKKYAIRHKNDPMDWGRNTTIDEGFYDLPESVQNKVIEVMVRITDGGFGIFPAGWKEAMNAQKTFFDEN